jgi:hypothetical protein
VSATCADLEAGLLADDPALAAAFHEHAEGCPACRDALRAWEVLREAAPSLRKEWPSPDLQDRIRARLLAEAAEPSRPASGRRLTAWTWATLAAAASLVVALIGLQLRPAPSSSATAAVETAAVQPPPIDESRRLLTEQALAEVEKAEEAYVRSIDALQHLAEPQLQQRSPILANYREKLLVLDSAIADCRAQIERNRFNAHVRVELLAAYRAKQQTLESLLKEDAHAM